jgi:uncharacterized protein YxjI
MKLLFKQRLFSWLDSYDIYDESGNIIFTVKGVLAWGHCLKIYNVSGIHVGTVKEEVFSFLPRFRMYVGDDLVGEIKKEFTFFKPKFSLDCNGWLVNGDFLEWNYNVLDGNRTVMSASKKLWNFTDTYEIDVMLQEDLLYSLMIVLAIDAAKCSSNND